MKGIDRKRRTIEKVVLLFIGLDNAVEQAMIEIFWIQLFVQIYYFYRILLSQNVQKPLSRIPSLVNECPIVVFEVVDTLLIVLDQLCSLNLHDLINLQEELLRFLHGPK